MCDCCKKIIVQTEIGIPGPQGPQGIPGNDGFTHYLGEPYLDGVIFNLYKGSDGLEHGHIVGLSPTGGLAWSNTNIWGGTGARSWDGFYNTSIMIDSPIKTAVQSFGLEWYIPSLDELNILYNHRYYVNKTFHSLGMTGASLLEITAGYWASNERNADDAYVQSFFSGIVVNVAKNTDGIYRTRAIKSF